jgi:signal transduction histidine kinase
VSAIASTLRRRWIEVAWAIFALLNVVFVFRTDNWESIPFHLIWVSLTLVYWARLWRIRTTIIVVIATALISELAMWHSDFAPGGPGLDDLFEVPLLASMFMAMVWYAERFRAAIGSRDRILEQERAFVRNASHELRTPITVAIGHVELIRDDATTQQMQEDADIVLDELGRLSRMSERLLILAATEHPNFLRLGEMDVEPFLEHMANRWSATVSRQWRVRCTASGSLMADRERLEVVLDALIENAVRFTAEAEMVALASHQEGDHVVIQVIDTGAGIPADQLPKVFDAFARGDAARGRGSGGTGLGLAIVEAVVEAHGGTVNATSDPGHLTTFSIRLPRFQRSNVRSNSMSVPPPTEAVST